MNRVVFYDENGQVQMIEYEHVSVDRPVLERVGEMQLPSGEWVALHRIKKDA